jgi:hypothetical protein
LEEVLKPLGPWPILQFLAGVAFVLIAIRAATKGSAESKSEPPPYQLSAPPPDMLMQELELIKYNQKVMLTLVQEIRNDLLLRPPKP